MFQDSLTKKIAEAASKIKTEYHEVEVNVNSVEGAGLKIMDEELVGNQHKIDANKNKKIDAHDFKLLRAQKDKEKANSQKSGKDVKEEVGKKKDLPFTPNTVKKPVKNSDGTVQSPMSRARELAQQGMKKVMKKEEVEEILEYKSKDGVYKHKGTYGSEKGVEYGETDFDKENKLAKKHLSPKPTKVKYGARQNFVRSKRVNESFSDMISSYQEDGLKYIASLVKEEPDSEEFKKELDDQKSKMDGKKKGGDVAKASVQAVKSEEYEVIDANEINGVRIDTIEERSLTEPEEKKKEEMVKGMKKGMAGFKERYGDRAKEVMYATATSKAKGE